MLDRTATAWLRRLLTWLELFEDCFGRQSQRGALRRYVTGLLSDSRRKSMEAMWARLSDPGTYQAFQHFITHAPWDAEALWKRLRAVVPERTGVLILDGTSFPKQGTASVGVARQYCGARGKIANCQIAVTVALWTGARAWLLGAHLYLPEAWLTARQRTRAQIPAAVRFAAEMAVGVDAAAAGARGGVYAHRRGRRCGVRRQRHAAPHVASRQAAVRVGGVVRSQGVPGDARARRRPRR